jgi:thiol-disulfide isomerase/thioredoxin
MLKLNLLIILFLCSFPLVVLGDEPELDDDGNPIAKLDKAPLWYIKNDTLELSSERLLGKAYVLHFWATWCPDCKLLQSGLETVSHDYIKKGIDTYAISFWENPRAKATQEMASRGLDFTVLEEGDEVAKLFAVERTPTTVFVNHKGEVLLKYVLSDPNDPQLRLAFETLVDGLKQRDKELAEKAAESQEG